MKMKVGESGKQLFKLWEGLEKKVYLDSGGAPTIGVGHLLTRSERTSGKLVLDGVAYDYRKGLTEAECWALLDQDLVGAEKCVNDAVKVKINQNQYDALISFVFNVGNAAFTGSTLLKLLNQGLYIEVPAQLRRWNKDNGHVVLGLTNRREKEIVLWNTPV
ncbi:MAG TPA: lysozyme [Methylophilaceae bacterium]|nr:lysozyme [Methylophilaceae bacterium]